MQQMIARLRRMAAEKHIAIVMYGGYIDASARAVLRWYSLATRPRRDREDNVQICLLDRFKVDDLCQPLEIAPLDVDLFELRLALLRFSGQLPDVSAAIQRFDFARGLRQSRRTVGRRELDAVAFRRIMRSGKIDRSIGLRAVTIS